MANALTNQFEGMYAAQTAIIGTAIRATVTGFVTNARAVLSSVDAESFVMAGGVALRGGFTLLMLKTGFASEPPKQTPVTANGPADGLALEIVDIRDNGGTYEIQVADYAAMTT